MEPRIGARVKVPEPTVSVELSSVKAFRMLPRLTSSLPVPKLETGPRHPGTITIGRALTGSSSRFN